MSTATAATTTAAHNSPPEAKRPNWFARISMAIIALLWTVPTIGMIVTSFRPLTQAESSGWWSTFLHGKYISSLTFANYTEAIEKASLWRAFVNSFAITLPATFIPILIAAFAAYAFTFMEFKGRDVLFLTIVSLLVVPNYVAFVPIQKLYAQIGIGGSFPTVWLAHIGFGMSLAIYILRNYMATLPRTVIESAKIDGASHFQTFWKLVLPMSMPALASFAIFQFLWVWNDLLVALVFLGPNEDTRPVTVALKNSLLSQQGSGANLVAAGGMFTMIVPIVVFLALQRYFVRGLTAGAVKG
ncbi:MAG: carbohydrate ABC transporter permease [Nocardioides sp.]|jgi:alpha-glucoside transport system permease protein